MNCLEETEKAVGALDLDSSNVTDEQKQMDVQQQQQGSHQKDSESSGGSNATESVESHQQDSGSSGSSSASEVGNRRPRSNFLQICAIVRREIYRLALKFLQDREAQYLDDDIFHDIESSEGSNSEGSNSEGSNGEGSNSEDYVDMSGRHLQEQQESHQQDSHQQDSHQQDSGSSDGSSNVPEVESRRPSFGEICNIIVPEMLKMCEELQKYMKPQDVFLDFESSEESTTTEEYVDVPQLQEGQQQQQQQQQLQQESHKQDSIRSSRSVPSADFNATTSNFQKIFITTCRTIYRRAINLLPGNQKQDSESSEGSNPNEVVIGMQQLRETAPIQQQPQKSHRQDSGSSDGSNTSEVVNAAQQDSESSDCL